MRRVTLLLSLWLLVAVSLTLNSSLAQPGATKAVSSDLERPIHACEQQVASWRSEERIEIAFVIAVIVFGVIISTLQGLNSRWTKTTTLVLGVATAIITSVNSRVFTADDRTLRRAAFEGDAVIRQLWVMADTMNDEHLSQQDRLSLKGDYLKKLLEFQAIGEKLNGTATKNAASEKVEETFGVFARVYAQSNMVVPAWAQNPPSDNISLYYVGKGYDPSLTNAKQYALDDAFHNAVLALRQQAPDASDAALLALIKASAVVQDSSFAYDQKAGNYACYTLLRLSKEVQSIGVKSLPPANKAQSPPARFQSKGWRPGDLMANPSSGMFVLDTAGGVSRLVVDQPASPRIEKLSQLMRTDSGYALTANAESVFVASTNQNGCIVYRYSLASKAVSQRLLAVHERCVGIATDGSAFHVTMPERNEIRYWDSWDAPSSHSWALAGVNSHGYAAFDNIGHRLIVADASGTAYAISVPGGKVQLLASTLGSVSSIATSRFQIFVASGKKILFLSRFDNRGENPPAGLQFLTGGHIVGVAVDAADRLWFADYDNKLVAGPFPVI